MNKWQKIYLPIINLSETTKLLVKAKPYKEGSVKKITIVKTA
jgi:hypothetical protein